MTEPLGWLLDRDLARKNAEQYNKEMGPLLREVINYSTMVFGRCLSSIPPASTKDVHVVHMFLFRQIIEFSDAIDVMLSRSCVRPTILTLRSIFETQLGLEYQLEDSDTEDQRTLSWVHGDVLQRLRRNKAILDQDHAILGDIPDHIKADTRSVVDALTRFLDMPHMAGVVDEYKNHPNRRPKWFSLFGGPNTIRDLAEHVDKKDLYDLLYREWSSTTHSDGGLQEIVRPHGDPGKTYIRSVRHPNRMDFFVKLAVNFVTQTILLMTDRFREDEYKERNEWYKNEVKSKLDKMTNATIDETDIDG